MADSKTKKASALTGTAILFLFLGLGLCVKSYGRYPSPPPYTTQMPLQPKQHRAMGIFCMAMGVRMWVADQRITKNDQSSGSDDSASS